MKGKNKGTGKGKGTRKGTGKGKGERESTNALAIFFLNHLDRSEKSANYAVLYRKERYSMYVVLCPAGLHTTLTRIMQIF
jgi:hypothetical protein